MNNPFKYLIDADTQNVLNRRQKRKQTGQERNLAVMREADERIAKRQAAEKQLIEIQNQFDGIVRNLLEPLAQLLRDVYAEKRLKIVVNTFSYRTPAYVYWAIGWEGEDDLIWKTKVTLELDVQWHPLRFRCERQPVFRYLFENMFWLPYWLHGIEWGSIYFKPQMAGLTQDELQAAIMQLYPPGSLLPEIH